MKIEPQPGCNTPTEPGVITVNQAVQNILSEIQPISDFSKLHIRQCLDRVSFEDVKSPIDVPGFNNSAMDGYALNSQYLPENDTGIFRIVGTAFAGKPYNGHCGEYECVRIMTGAVVPEQTDTIVVQEEVRILDSESVEIGTDHRRHQNIRFSGEDIQTGATVLSSGTLLKAANLGVLASLGINEIKVFRKPRISFFSTGDELKSIGDKIEKGEIYDSNRYSLHGLLSECDVDLIDMGVVIDDPELIRQTLLSAAACSDFIVTSGGVSVGEADYIKTVLQEIGRMNIWKIAMKPGRPLTFGKINNSLFFGLPGNPVAVMVTFYQFVLPAIKKLKGMPYKPPLQLKAETTSSIRKNPGRTEFQRAIAENDDQGKLKVSLTGKQGSGILTSMSQANCFIVLSEEAGQIESGDTVDIQLFDCY